MCRIRIGALVWGIMGMLATGYALAGQVSRGDLGAVIYAETSRLAPCSAPMSKAAAKPTMIRGRWPSCRPPAGGSAKWR